uniref:Putative secreted protein n=1 Tax=Amblyomma triste TaxID=251400 RepID=A0A023G4W5_AMBTT
MWGRKILFSPRLLLVKPEGCAAFQSSFSFCFIIIFPFPPAPFPTSTVFLTVPELCVLVARKEFKCGKVVCESAANLQAGFSVYFTIFGVFCSCRSVERLEMWPHIITGHLQMGLWTLREAGVTLCEGHFRIFSLLRSAQDSLYTVRC